MNARKKKIRSRKPMRNHIKPIYSCKKIQNCKIDGFSGNYTFAGETCHMNKKNALTSYDPQFNTMATSLCNIFGLCNKSVNNLLVTINEDDIANVYTNFPITVEVTGKKSIKKGELVYHDDIVDYKTVSFHDSIANLNPKEGEKVVWIFRDGFRFGLYFDLSSSVSLEALGEELAILFKRVKYFNFYDAIDNEFVTQLIKLGWFPFIDIIGSESDSLLSLIQEKRLTDVSRWFETLFPNERITNLVDRWWNNKYFKHRKNMIMEGIESFYSEKYVSSISTLSPLLEGIINDYSYSQTGKGIKYNGQVISNTVSDIGNEKYSIHSLTLPSLFESYLNEHYYKNTRSAISDENVRNTVTHGRAKPESFTRSNALKIILTLDQIRYYLPSETI